MNPRFKIAGVQMDVALANPGENLRRMERMVEATAGQGASLTVFPECALTGYCFESLQEALPVAETIPGPATHRLSAVCRRAKVSVVFGMLEIEGDRMFNACVLVAPDGVVGSYRKVHLPFLGVDRFTTPGNRPFSVHRIADVVIGMNICYDAAFPEAARALALAGADLIVLPTNWPLGALCTAQHVIHTRALENHVYYMAVNRVGHERGFDFIGHSKICDPNGQVMAENELASESIVYAEIDPSFARNKRRIHVPGKYEIDRLRDRRPEMYGLLVAPSHEDNSGAPGLAG